MKPVFLAAILFVLLPPNMEITWYKAGITVAACVVAVILSIRIKDKIVLHWLMVIGRYNLRPKYYVFDKNDPYLRQIDLIKEEVKQEEDAEKIIAAPIKSKDPATIPSLLQFQDLQAGLSFKVGRKGGLNVAFEQVKR